MITEPSVPQTDVSVTLPEGLPPHRARQNRRPGRSWRAVRMLAALTRRHWILAGLLVAGLGLRVITQIAYRPALFYIDSYRYLTGSAGYDPEGYRFLLAPILWAGNLAVVPAFQHLLGLAMGLAIYMVLVRRGAPRWGAALAAAPILLDAYQLQMEQTIMPDVVFEAFILGGLVILLWKPRPGLGRIIAGALVMGLATDVRQVGEALIVPVAVFAALVVRGGWRRAGHLGLAAACFAVPVLGYMAISQVTGNGFALTTRGTDVLYGRAAVDANCATLKIPRYERPLCAAPAEKSVGIDRILNDADGPYRSYQPPPGKTANHAVDDFVARVATQQPLSMPLSVLRDSVRFFALTRDGTATITPISRWQFQPAYATYPPGVTLPFVASQGQHYGGGGPVTIRPLAAFLRGYQLYGGYTPGPLLAAMTAAGVAGSLAVFSRRRRKRPARQTGRPERDDRMLAAGTLLATLNAVAVVLGSDVFEFSWRYQLPALVTLPLGGVLGGTLLAGRLRRRAAPGSRQAPGAAQAPDARPASLRTLRS